MHAHIEDHLIWHQQGGSLELLMYHLAHIHNALLSMFTYVNLFAYGTRIYHIKSKKF